MKRSISWDEFQCSDAGLRPPLWSRPQSSNVNVSSIDMDRVVWLIAVVKWKEKLFWAQIIPSWQSSTNTRLNVKLIQENKIKLLQCQNKHPLRDNVNFYVVLGSPIRPGIVTVQWEISSLASKHKQVLRPAGTQRLAQRLLCLSSLLHSSHLLDVISPHPPCGAAPCPRPVSTHLRGPGEAFTLKYNSTVLLTSACRRRLCTLIHLLVFVGLSGLPVT